MERFVIVVNGLPLIKDKPSSGDIQSDYLKQCDLCLQAQSVTNCINSSNQCTVSGECPDSFKLANISPAFVKTNYRSASILPFLPKI